MNRGNANRKLSRRQLLERLAIASGAIAVGHADQPKQLKAVWVNHYVYFAPDLNKTVDWYHEVFGMQVAHRSRKEAHLWYGDAGADTCMIVRQAAAGVSEAKIINIGFTLDRWDKNAVEAELKRRGLNPVSDTNRCFRFKDLEGFEIALCASNYLERPAGSNEKPAVWKAVSANHIVENSRDYGKLRDWYEDLLALKITHDSGRDVYMWMGDTVWIPTASRAGGRTSAELGTLDHVAYSIADYNNDAVKAELEKRNMQPHQDTMLSFNCRDVNNFKTQVCDKRLVPEAEKRPATAGRGRN